jgi:hypothetical protein
VYTRLVDNKVESGVGPPLVELVLARGLFGPQAKGVFFMMNSRTLQRRVVWGFTAILVAVLSPGQIWADGGADHQAIQARPIWLGTSGGNIYDSGGAFCCSGTLGALVQDGNGTQYILSNNHVLARSSRAGLGEEVNQPGMIDQNCSQNGIVAHLSNFVNIQYNKGKNPKTNDVDAAIAQVVPGEVSPDGAILDIGTLSANTRAAVPGMGVQKSGRTTGHTTGTVDIVNATVNVAYSKNCGGGGGDIATFIDQIIVTSGPFSAGGDSGSVIVENGSVDPANGRPRAVGLLFAGSESGGYTIANPIDAVLTSFGVSMVGLGTGPPPATGSVAGTVTASDGGAAIGGATVSADTGQSATTAGDGSYTISGVPEGSRTITASASGYADASQGATVVDSQTSTANFALDAAAAGSQASVDCVIYSGEGGKRGDRHLLITISAKDESGAPVVGAEVQIDVDRDGSFFASGSGAVTNSSGQVTYQSKNAPDGLYETTVTAINGAGLTFDSNSTPTNGYNKGTDPVPSSFCNSGSTSTTAPASSSRGVNLSKASAAKARNSARLLSVPGVVGHGVGVGANGDAVIKVFLATDDASARRQIPNALDDVEVQIIITGEFVAY